MHEDALDVLTDRGRRRDCRGGFSHGVALQWLRIPVESRNQRVGWGGCGTGVESYASDSQDPRGTETALFDRPSRERPAQRPRLSARPHPDGIVGSRAGESPARTCFIAASAPHVSDSLRATNGRGARPIGACRSDITIASRLGHRTFFPSAGTAHYGGRRLTFEVPLHVRP